MGQCCSNNKIKDLSHLKSPVQAARYCHTIKNYDNNIGKFLYENEIYILNKNGYYELTSC